MAALIKRWQKWFKTQPMDSRSPLTDDIASFLAEIKNEPIFATPVLPGMDIILVGHIGLAGTCLLGRYYEAELLKRLPDWWISETQVLHSSCHRPVPDKLLATWDIATAYDVAEGGLYRTLSQLGKDTGKGYRIFYSDIPVYQSTIEYCEIFDMDPLKLFSCGCQLIVAPRSSRILRKLQAQGISDCAIIGQISSDHDKVLVHRDFESLINRPDPDELLCLLQKD